MESLFRLCCLRHDLLFKACTFMQKERVREESVPDLKFREICLSLCLSVSVSISRKRESQNVQITTRNCGPSEISSCFEKRFFLRTRSLFCVSGAFGAQKHLWEFTSCAPIFFYLSSALLILETRCSDEKSKKQKSRRETSNRARVCTLESEKERVKERE